MTFDNARQDRTGWKEHVSTQKSITSALNTYKQRNRAWYL